MKKFSTPFLICLFITSFFSASLYFRRVHKFQSPKFAEVPGHSIPKIFSFLDVMENTLYDFRISNMPQEIAKHVFVGTIDEAALSYYGRWPWNRYQYKNVLEDLYELGAEVVAFDAVFSEPE